MTDVLVVGAGPVGLTMAAELKRYGLAVRIVETAAARTDKSKALVVWSRTLELLARAGCAEKFVAAGMKVVAANISANGKPIGRVTLDQIDSPYPFGLMIPQSETERLLEEHLAELGVQVERTVSLISFAENGAIVSSRLKHADGSEETVETAWLIGCDGAHSAVRHGLGLGFEGDTLESDWLLGDVHLEGVPHPREIEVIWHAKGILVLFPIAGTRYRVLADASASQTGADIELADIQSLLDERGPGGITASDPVWLAPFHINERKVKDYRLGRVFVAGDAAHIHSPAGGQGMNTGMQDAFNLAWKLALVQRGMAAETLLDSYTPERGAVGEQVMKAAGQITRVAILKPAWEQTIRNHVAALLLGSGTVQHKVAEALTEMAIGYPKSPLNGRDVGVGDGPRVGERAPIRADESPVGAGDTPRFAVFGVGAPSQYAKLLEPEARAPFAEGGLWLVRPDGYCVVAAKAGEWGALEEFLGRVAG